MIDLVLAYDADLSAMNQDKLSPFNLAMKANNIKLLEKLSDKIRFSKTPALLFDFAPNVFDDRYKKFLIKILDKEPTIEKEKLNVLDKNGFTPFLGYLKEFADKKEMAFFKNKIRSN